MSRRIYYSEREIENGDYFKYLYPVRSYFYDSGPVVIGYTGVVANEQLDRRSKTNSCYMPIKKLNKSAKEIEELCKGSENESERLKEEVKKLRAEIERLKSGQKSTSLESNEEFTEEQKYPFLADGYAATWIDVGFKLLTPCSQSTFLDYEDVITVGYWGIVANEQLDRRSKTNSCYMLINELNTMIAKEIEDQQAKSYLLKH